MAHSQKMMPNLKKAEVNAAVLTPQGSKTFIRKMVPLSVSFILHQRVEFPETEFKSYKYEGICYKAFGAVLRSETLRHVKNWVRGAMDALEKNYLRELFIMLVNANDPDTVYESYKFQFKYMGDDVIHIDPDIPKKDLRESTTSMVQAIESLGEFTKYTEAEVDIKMAVTYYEDVTPEDYVPPFFRSTPDSSLLNALKNQSPNYLLLGLLKTGFHVVKCRGKGDVFAMNRTVSSLSLANVSKENATEDQAVEELMLVDDSETQLPQPASSLTLADVIGKDLAEVVNQQSVLSPTVSSISEIEIEISDSAAVPTVVCVCRITSSFESIQEVKCSQCLSHLHCACLAYLDKKDMPENFLCPWCDGGDQDNLTPMKNYRKKMTHIYRLVVAYAYFTQAVPNEVLDMLMPDTKKVILKKLKDDKILTKGKHGLTVNVKLLESNMLKYLFYNSFSNKHRLPASMSLGSSEELVKNSDE